MNVSCPTCKRLIEWSTSPWRPFCSERCKLIDLGAWASEKHAIPENTPLPETDTEPSSSWISDTDSEQSNS